MTIKAISFQKNQSHDGTQSSHVNGANQPPRNKVMPSPHKAKRPRYSPRKNSANLKPEYSVKYPAMISDSASGRSNGARFASAAAAIRNRMNPKTPHGVKRFHACNPAIPAAD